jgi:hypothetical protein
MNAASLTAALRERLLDLHRAGARVVVAYSGTSTGSPAHAYAVPQHWLTFALRELRHPEMAGEARDILERCDLLLLTAELGDLEARGVDVEELRAGRGRSIHVARETIVT